MTSLDELAPPALADVRPGTRWPWLALAAGAVIVTVGGFAFTPAQPAPRPAGDQPPSSAAARGVATSAVGL
ncbi:hypothetical protein [Mycolicibacterium arenosum]|uniref:Uncharacterized protein n=1 Tax=Mycolicibacterium arenosum TaxID=2952157 RepID=A0ABT1M2Z6_9MYCO|nr:hypothetical protein [Mycolicibacterium sp. CAU 1645]MCP9273534.1 hypothetical protein [Mycolicibacterium sp. CAU 1645]